MPALSPLRSLLFVLLCLVLVPAQAFTWQKTRGPEGAWVVGLDETSDGTLWLAARGGGVYSRVGNGQWVARNGGLTRTDLVDLVIAADGTPVAATAGGLFRFVSGSWVAANSGIPFASSSSVIVESLFRAANGHLFASANSLYRSTDNGQSWTETTNGLAGTVVNGSRFAQVRFVKQDSNGNLFLGTADAGNRLYVSTDGGANWVKRESGLGTSLVLSVSSDRAGNAYAYLPAGDVYRTANAGESWTRAANNGSAIAAGIHATLVAPDGVFYAGQGSNFAVTSLRRSTNGSSYAAVNNLNTAGAPLHQQGSGALVLRAVGGGRLLAGFNGAGVWQSSDGSSWVPMNEGLDAGLINAVYGGPGSLLAAGRGTGNQCTTDGGAAWTTTNYVLQSLDVTAFLKPASGNRLLMANIIRTVGASNIFSSIDGGATWSAFGNSQQPLVTRLFEAGGVIYAAAAGTTNAQLAYQQSTTGGETWTTLGAPSAGGQDLAADSAGNLYAISSAGIHRRSAGSTSWTRIDNVANNGLPSPAVWGSVIGDTSGNVYLVSLSTPTGQPGVYMSANGGNSWVLRASGLPADQLGLGLASLRFEKGPDGAIYLLSKQAGLFRTVNGGESWSDENGNLPTPAADPAGQRGLLSLGFAADGTAFAGLEGNGVWVAGALGSGSYNRGVNCAAGTGPDANLDPAYGTGGYRLATAPNTDVYEGAVDSQGRFTLVSMGESLQGVVLTRFTADGAIDTGFGSNGRLNVASDRNIDRVSHHAMAVQADDKLVIALSLSSSNFGQCTVARVTTSGALDPSFGNGGLATVPTSLAAQSSCDAIALAEDGSVLVGGEARPSAQPSLLAVYRFRANGTLDAGFGSNGAYILAEGSGRALALETAANGAVLVGARLTVNSQSRQAVFQLGASGARDTTFGSNGEVALGNTSSLALARRGNGQFAALVDGFVFLFDASGQRVTGFGTNGSQNVRTSANSNRIAALNTIRFRNDGSLLIGGDGNSNNLGLPLLMLLNGNGSFNTGFGDNGIHVFLGGFTAQNRPCANGAGYAGGLLDGQGRALLGGRCSNGNAASPIALRTRVLPPDSTAPAADTTPDAFSFAAQTDVPTGSVRLSDTVTIRGIDAPTAVMVSGGEYSVGCTASFTSQAGSIASGQTICLRHTASAQPSTTVTTMLNVGGVTANFASTTAAAGSGPGPGPSDTTPDAFSFTDQQGVARGAVVTSAAITIAGIDAPSAIGVSGGEYSIGCTASFTAAAGNISNGQSVCVRHTASAAGSTATNTVLTIGGVSDTFTSTTVPADTTPDAFAFGSRSDVEPGAAVESETVTIRGIDGPSPVTVQNGEYRVNGGSYGTAAGSLNAGDTLQLRHTASLAFNTPVSTTVSVGGVSASFTSTTRAQAPPPAPDTTPDAFRFEAQSGVVAGSAVSSNTVNVSGINAPAAISVTGGEYRIDQGAFTAAAGTVSNGSTVQLRLTAAAAGQTATATLSIGGVSASFSVSSAAAPPPPTGSSAQFMDAGNRAVTLSTSAGRIVNARTVTAPPGIPGGVRFGNGVFAFDVEGVTPGAIAEITLQLPAGSAPTSYYKFGTEPGVPFDHYYRFGFDAATGTGARISGDTVTLLIRDNGRGDHDPTPGRIADPGAPAVDEGTAVDLGTGGGGSFGWLTLFLLLPALARRRTGARA